MWPEIRKFASELPLVGPALRSAYRKAHGLPDVEGAQSDAPDFRYHSWIERRVRERAADYPAPAENAPRFDILTLVFNTDPDVLRKTAASVFAQDYANFRWVIWDNGSSKAETRSALAEIAKDSRVHFHRNEQNLGITTGHLKALELCNAEYVALLDHDDLLYPDALRINAWHIDFFARPDFLYSDEDKCDMQDRRYWPYFKPDFSPALLLDTGYTCHLSVVKRETLLTCGAFTDPAVEGAQDWDMALRIQDHLKQNYAERIIHIPEMLYTWRGVPESTAVRGVEAKPHVIAAQKRCVESALERRGLRGKVDPHPSRLFPIPDGHWECQTDAMSIVGEVELLSVTTQAPAIASIEECKIGSTRFKIRRVKPEDLASALSERISSKDCTEFIGVLGDAHEQHCYLLDAVRVFQIFPNAAMAVGRTDSGGGPRILGLEFNDTKPVDLKEPGYFAQNLVCRNVLGFNRGPWMARTKEVQRIGIRHTIFPALWDADLSVRLVLEGKEIVCSPMMSSPDFEMSPSEDEILGFIREHHDLIRDDPYYSPFCSLKSESLYSIVEPAERAAVLNPLFEKAGVPLVPTDRYELGRYKRLRRKNP
jgi:hypothetical protein